MPLTDLPSDLFLTILSYLTPHEVGRLSQVCVLLQQESTREGVWRGFTRTLFQRYYPDGLALYEEDKQACWRARSERRRLRFQSSRASALATIQRWGEAGSSSGGGGSSSPGSSSGSGGGSPGSAWEESAAAVALESCSDSELDELDERERAAYAARLLAAGIAVQEAECSAPPSATAAAAARQASPTLAALALRQRRRQLRAQRQASAARAAALRLAALEDFQATRQRRAGGSYRLAFPSLPLVRAAHPGAPPAEVGVYAMRCWYIRNGVQSTFHPVPDSVLKCVYHRALLLRADGSALYASTPGELPEALRHFARALRRAEGGGGAAAAAQGPAATLAEWGPAPEGVPGMGRPVAHGELASSVCRGPEEGGVSRAAAAAAAAAAEAAGAGAGGGAGAAAAPAPPSRKPRAERGDHTLGRGVWRQEGRKVEVCYVTGGHNILTRLQLALSSEEMGEGEEEGRGGGGGGVGSASSRAVFAQWSNTLTVEQMLVGSIGSEEGTVMNLRGERFYHYPLTAGVQALP